MKQFSIKESIYKLVTGLTILLLVTCKKDPLPESPCYDIPPSKSPFGYQYLEMDSFCTSVYSVNGSSTEIAFIERRPNNKSYIRIADLLTHKISTIYEGGLLGTLSCHKNKIIFRNSSDGQLWAIKTNGDSLQRITNYSHPQFFPDICKKDGRICANYNGNFVQNSCLIILNEEYKTVDSVVFSDYTSYVWLKPAWNYQGDKIAAKFYDGTSEGIIVLALYSHTTEIITKSPYESSVDISCLRWHPDGKRIFYSTAQGIYSIDLNTQKTHLILGGCDTKEYSNFDITSDGFYLICQRIDRIKVNEEQIDQYSSVYRINLMTLKEEAFRQ